MQWAFVSLVILLAFIWSIIRITVRGKLVVVFFHHIVYDVAVWNCFVPNWFICLLCHFQRGNQRLDDVHPQQSISREEFLQKLDAGAVFDDEQLLGLFDELPPAQASQLIGKTFDGTILKTNKSVLDLAQLLLVLPLQAIG